MEEWHSKKELPENIQDYIASNMVRRKYNMCAFIGGIMVMGSAMCGLSGLEQAVVSEKGIQYLFAFLIAVIPFIVVGLLLIRTGSRNAHNFIQNLDYQWRYGTVTGKRLLSRQGSDDNCIISVDGIEYFAVSIDDYRKAKVGSCAVLIRFPELSDLSVRKMECYVMIAESECISE